MYVSTAVYALRIMRSCWRYLSLGEYLGLLALLQTGSKCSHDMFLCANHLNYLLVTLHSHGLVDDKRIHRE